MFHSPLSANFFKLEKLKTLNRNILNEISSGNVIKLFDDISVTQKLDEVKHFAATKSQQQFWEINYFASKFCQNYWNKTDP